MRGGLFAVLFPTFHDCTCSYITYHDLLTLGLKKFIKKNVDAESDSLAVLDSKLGSIVKEKMGIQCINKCDLR